VLDTAAGRAAAGVRVVLWRLSGGEARLFEGITNADGRLDRPLLTGADFALGTYRLDFHVGDYFRTNGAALADPAFLDVIPIRFGIATHAHYHVPLLVAPYGYTTYRGS
jgi:5-hydroxyisourate hydrolase